MRRLYVIKSYAQATLWVDFYHDEYSGKIPLHCSIVFTTMNIL